MPEIDFTQGSEEPTQYLDDLSPNVLQELGNAVKQIKKGYSTLREHIIGDTKYGKIVSAGDFFSLLTSYAEGNDIDSIADSYQQSPENIIEILKTIGFSEDELKKDI
ncbi:hypothetical protein GQ472_03935 [archaeon]|nr:hypothetical protein [archaeon]